MLDSRIHCARYLGGTFFASFSGSNLCEFAGNLHGVFWGVGL